jgi:hypothetical protein
LLVLWRQILAGFGGKACSNVRQDRSHGRWKTHWAAFADNLSIDQDFEFPILPMQHLDVGLEFTPDPGRHTDGLQTGDSKRTEADGDSCHDGPLVKSRDRATMAPSTFAAC